MITYKLKDGTTSTVAPVKPRIIRKRRSWNINQAGRAILDPIKEYLMSEPNKTAKEIGAKFSDINFHTIRYHLARGVKFEHLFVTTGSMPLYNVNPAKVFNN